MSNFKAVWSLYSIGKVRSIGLEEYRANPSELKAVQLRLEFDTLFSTITGYNDLDERILKTKTKKTELLLPLKYPEMPLHNNPAELGARQRVRKRDVSFGPRTKDGTAIPAPRLK